MTHWRKMLSGIFLKLTAPSAAAQLPACHLPPDLSAIFDEGDNMESCFFLYFSYIENARQLLETPVYQRSLMLSNIAYRSASLPHLSWPLVTAPTAKDNFWKGHFSSELLRAVLWKARGWELEAVLKAGFTLIRHLSISF